MPPRFFITHSWKDIRFARRLCKDMRANGLRGFFDAYSIKPGDLVAAEIQRGLEACDVYVPILSYTALESPWCDEEINAAITLGKLPGRSGRPRIIPILIENCQDKMPVFLHSRLYINFSDRYENALKELLMKGFGLSGVKAKQSKEIPLPRNIDGSIDYEQLPVPPKFCKPESLDYLIRGVTDTLNRNLDQAVANFTKAIEIDPGNSDAYRERGRSFQEQGWKARAIADFTTYLQLEPNAPERATVEQWITELK